MPGHGSVFGLGGTFADRYGFGDPAMVGGLLRVMARAAHPAAAPQVLQQLFLQRSARLDEERAIDRLVGHLVRLVLRVRALERCNSSGRACPATIRASAGF